MLRMLDSLMWQENMSFRWIGSNVVQWAAVSSDHVRMLGNDTSVIMDISAHICSPITMIPWKYQNWDGPSCNHKFRLQSGPAITALHLMPEPCVSPRAQTCKFQGESILKNCPVLPVIVSLRGSEHSKIPFGGHIMAASFQLSISAGLLEPFPVQPLYKHRRWKREGRGNPNREPLHRVWTTKCQGIRKCTLTGREQIAFCKATCWANYGPL